MYVFVWCAFVLLVDVFVLLVLMCCLFVVMYQRVFYVQKRNGSLSVSFVLLVTGLNGGMLCAVLSLLQDTVDYVSSMQMPDVKFEV